MLPPIVLLSVLGFSGPTAHSVGPALRPRLPSPAPALLRPARCAAPRCDFSSNKETRFKMDAKDGEVAEVPFEVRFSIGNVVAASGGVLFVYSIVSFILNNGESDLAQTLGFVYAIPALVGGLALKYAELPPVPMDSSPAAEALRSSRATMIQAKIVSDATRYTYGDAHMEDPLKALKLAPRGMGPPQLVRLAEATTPTGQYGLTMRFYAPNTPYRVWQDRAPRYARFFGPGVRAVLKKLDVERRLVELSLITLAEGEDDSPLEVQEDGSTVPVLTAAAEEAAKAKAKAPAPAAEEAEETAETSE